MNICMICNTKFMGDSCPKCTKKELNSKTYMTCEHCQKRQGYDLVLDTKHLILCPDCANAARQKKTEEDKELSKLARERIKGIKELLSKSKITYKIQPRANDDGITSGYVAIKSEDQSLPF